MSSKRDVNVTDASKKLTIEDTRAQKMRGLQIKTRSGKGGYNPYEAEAVDKSTDADGKQRKKPTDLRKLSEWIRLTREIDELKKNES